MPNAYCTTGANRRRASGFDLASGRAMEDGRDPDRNESA